jgi:hypothetical protein
MIAIDLWSVMSEPNYVQLIRSDEAKFLLANHPLSFAVLSFIAIHARRYNGHPDGLIIGDALVSSECFPGLSRQNFRTAIEKLGKDNFIKIVSNGKKLFEREKSTIKITIKGYLVNITCLTIYDINSDDGNQRNNQRVTNDQPTGNHKQERRRKNNKEKEEQIYAQSASPLHTKVESLFFNLKSSLFEGISLEDRKDWEVMFPNVNLDLEITKATQWLKSNPSRSNKKLWRKFLTGWFSRANDYAENKKAFKANFSSSPLDRRTKNPDGTPVKSRLEGIF